MSPMIYSKQQGPFKKRLPIFTRGIRGHDSSTCFFFQSCKMEIGSQLRFCQFVLLNFVT